MKSQQSGGEQDSAGMPGAAGHWSNYAFRLVAVFTAYVIGGTLGLRVPFTDWNVSPVWPPAGIALAAVLVWGSEVWPGIALGAFAVNFFSPIPPTAAIGLAIGNTSSAVIAGALLKRVVGFDRSLVRLRSVLSLIVYGAALGTAVAATVGTTTLYFTGGRPWSGFSTSWLIWWAGDAIGVLLFAPLVLKSVEALRRRTRPERLAECSVLVVGALLVCAAVFDGRFLSATPHYVLAFALFPFVMWAAVRFGVFGTSIVGSSLALITLWETANGRGPFIAAAPFFGAAMLQTFLLLISATGMVLAAAVHEREAAEDRLAREQQLIAERDAAETERRQAEQALFRNEKLAVAGRMAATIAHEINNPLSAVTNLVHLLRTGPLAEEQRKLIELLDSEVRRVAYIARHTLSFYRESAPAAPLRLAQVIDEILKIYSHRLGDLTVERRFSTDGQIEALPVEMHQVFSNLILNAAEAMGGGSGNMILEINDAPDDHVCVTVADNGPGIEEQNRKRIFEPFFSTKAGHGLGVGLWVTEAVVRKHGGCITVSSSTSAADHGTAFQVLLPKQFRQISPESAKSHRAS